MASLAEIQRVLQAVRDAIDNERFLPIHRRKNLDTLAQLGLTWADAKAEIYALQTSDYRGGPMEDRDEPSSDPFWVFKSELLEIPFT